MRKLLITFTILLAVRSAHAQFLISGHVKHFKDDYSLSLNVPYLFGYYDVNSQEIRLDNKGNFNLSIPVNKKKFFYLHYGDNTSILLATPGNTLHLEFDSLESKPRTIEGTAARENRVLFDTELSGVPYFMQVTDTSVNINNIHERIITPWFAKRDSSIARVMQNNMDPVDKKLIASELGHHALLQLHYYTNGYLKWKKRDRISFLFSMYDTMDIAMKPVQQGNVFVPGLMYYYFVGNYATYLETNAFTKHQATGSRNDVPLDYFGVTLDSGTRLIEERGKPFLTWMSIRNTFPSEISEDYLAQQIVNRYTEKDLGQAKQLLSAFTKTYPLSEKIAYLEERIGSLQLLANKYATDSSIRIFRDYDKLRSIYEVIGTQKGKVVYLDVWGTWCGPCKSELRYTPALKNHFKNKDVSFIYLDMDEDVKDDHWREFIRVNALSGLHLRKNREQIKPIWEELLLGQKDAMSYPSYFIFDRNGKLTVTNAKRPSDEQALYEQIEQVLTIP